MHPAHYLPLEHHMASPAALLSHSFPVALAQLESGGEVGHQGVGGD